MVMGWIWTGMVLLALGAAVLTGQTGALTAAALEGAASAIRLALGLAGALCLWSGAAKALERAGGMRALARLARPAFRRLFPQTAQDETAMGYLTANVAANLLGLGNAATPMGIAAVRRMQQRSGSARATDEMCRLIVLNTASIQLLPTTVAAVRAANGAAAPFDILPAVWLTSVCSVTAVHLLRASGAVDLLTRWLTPAARVLGLPPQVLPLVLLRPVSGSAALAVGADLMAQYGADSLIGRTAAVVLGSTETTFYTISVYFGAAGIRRTRYAVPAALIADLTGFLVAALTARFL